LESGKKEKTMFLKMTIEDADHKVLDSMLAQLRSLRVPMTNVRVISNDDEGEWVINHEELARCEKLAKLSMIATRIEKAIAATPNDKIKQSEVFPFLMLLDELEFLKLSDDLLRAWSSSVTQSASIGAN
jgi:hypothetical protein